MQNVSQVANAMEFTRPILLSPEAELLLAILDRAVLDYYGNDETSEEEACDWLFGGSDPNVPFSLEWICDYLGLQSTNLRGHIRKICIPREVSQAHRWIRRKVRAQTPLIAASA
mgnify:CR=1 FL=1